MRALTPVLDRLALFGRVEDLEWMIVGDSDERELDVLVFANRLHRVAHQERKVGVARRTGGVEDDPHRVARLPAVALFDLFDDVPGRLAEDLRGLRVCRLCRELPQQVVSVTPED